MRVELVLHFDENEEELKQIFVQMLAKLASAGVSGVTPEPKSEEEKTFVSELLLSTRVLHVFENHNVISIGDLLKCSERELLSWNNFGKVSLNEVRAVLAERGLSLAPFSRRPRE